jgi:hypothetical protein
MECEADGMSCIVCNSFKIPINVYKIVKRIADSLGIKEEIEYMGDGLYIAGEVEIKCEWIEFESSWSDYCIRCFVV